MEFYDDIADRYDAITGAAARVGRAAAFVAELLARRPIVSALDVACGTGLFAIELARAGVRTVATDLSSAMLTQAQRNAQTAGVRVEWAPAAMQELAGRIDRRFDVVLCMGNSIPHLLTPADLQAALAAFADRLHPGGIVALHLLNYVRVLERRERLVGIDRQGDREYVRFYDFLDGAVAFNILEIQWRGERAEHRLHTTTLCPYTAEALREALTAAGCRTVECFGGLRFEPFDRRQSETVLLVGHKGP